MLSVRENAGESGRDEHRLSAPAAACPIERMSTMPATMSFRLEGAPRGARAKEHAIERLAREIEQADAVMVGAGAGLSTAAGMTYSGLRFEQWFGDFERVYGFHDMYSGGFYPYPSFEEHWAFWARSIWCNRYEPDPQADALYRQVLRLLEGRDYFVLTTNVDHRFQLAGIDRHRLFYTQGDYGLFQCSEPCHNATYDNEEQIRAMMEAQGWRIDAAGHAALPEGTAPAMRVPTELVPRCPVCGRPMAMNLRSDGTFVEDEGWRSAASRYDDFRRRHEGLRVLYLELGVGWNTPGIVKVPFWQAVGKNPRATYACLNLGEANCPAEIAGRSLLIDGDIAETIAALASRVGSEA